MLGPECILVQRTPSGFRAIGRHGAATLQQCVLGVERDRDWLFHQCQRIAEALNKGEIALAQIYGLYIPVSELDYPELSQIALARITKADFDPYEPRLPSGDPHGGEWTTDGGVNGGATPSRGSFWPSGEGDNAAQDGGVSQLDGLSPDHAAPIAAISPAATETRPPGARAIRYDWLTPSGASVDSGANASRSSASHSEGTSEEISAVEVAAHVGSPAVPANLLLTPAAYQGHYHDQLVEILRQLTVQGGGAAIAQVPLTSVIDGTTAVADLIVNIPGHGTFIVEVKTGENPQFTNPQRAIYAWAPLGWHLISSKIEIGVVGLKAGEPLPPLPVLIYWAPGPGRPVRRWFIDPEFLP